MKTLIRLTEEDLHRIVKESTEKILSELFNTPQGQQMQQRLAQRYDDKAENARKGAAINANNGGDYATTAKCNANAIAYGDKASQIRHYQSPQ